MPSERYFLESSFEPQKIQEIKETEFHHLAHVMRTRKGDTIELINGQGALAQATVEELKKDKALVRINEIQQQSKPPCRLILAQAIPKPNRLEFILEKGTELGINGFWLFPGQHSVKKECFPNQIERARAVTISAMKQCGRLYLPTIDLLPSIHHWTNLKEKTAFFGDVSPSAPLLQQVWQKIPSPLLPIVFITGPEGGLSAQEELSLREQGASGVKLHENILRTETASLMAVSLLTHFMHQQSLSSTS